MRRLCELAAARGVRVSAHTYPELHRHCAFAWSSLDHVEAFAPSSEYDRSEAFIDADARIRAVDGCLTAPEQAGAGIQVDWPTVTESAVRSTCAKLPTAAGTR
jgi:L-alanine-DL-glutamate epimerase-like enolase superfamily enzyme